MVAPGKPELRDVAILTRAVEGVFRKLIRMLIGKMSWYIETTVLEMETAGELTRFPDTKTPLPMNVKR